MGSQLTVRRSGKVPIQGVLVKWIETQDRKAIGIRISSRTKCKYHYAIYWAIFSSLIKHQHRELTHNAKNWFNYIFTNNIN